MSVLGLAMVGTGVMLLLWVYGNPLGARTNG